MINIVENTLRDGSYLIDFQFDRIQTSTITAGLSKLGFKYIEIGHGLGLGAWNNAKAGLSKENDTEYIKAAREAAPDSQICVFFIPGIGTIDDIQKAVDSGIDFIRIGINIDKFEQAQKYAEFAKEKGLKVAINLMKSYGVKSYEFTKISKKIDSWQVADVIYLVDSAGCMMPEEVFEYIDRTKEKISTELGFHGHNNLSLAVANTMQAISAGASYIDTCIRGMGRSAGNAQSEIIIYLLQKMKISPIDTDLYQFYEFAERYIIPLMPQKQGLSAEEIHIGVSRFHTSYMPIVNNIALKYNIDKNKLIRNVSDINCINPTPQLFKKVAEQILKDGK